MTQEEKDLLLKDLCARLPYGVEVYYSETIPISTLKTINSEKESCIIYDHSQWYRHTKKLIKEIKPYLRPMSSMTEEEGRELESIFSENDMSCWVDTNDGSVTFAGGNDFLCPEVLEIYFDFLNAHHFDQRDLISKGLALEAPDGMYKIK